MRTRVGYAGGQTIDPTYHDLADHTEVFQLEYDPRVLSYGDLVDAIWRNRRGGSSYSRQYMEAVFAENAEQERIARERGVTAPIITGARFYLAEDYHQKYRLRHDKTLMREFDDYTPRQFIDSRVAARLNGYLSGKGTHDQLRAEIETFGMSSVANGYVEQLLAARG